MPTTRRARKGISDAQKQALRVYVSETHPTPSQRACVEWFRSKFGHLIDRATVSSRPRIESRLSRSGPGLEPPRPVPVPTL
jgi:hypothetical protein